MPYYELTLTPDDDGSILVTSKDFPEVTTSGADEAEALRDGQRAIEEAVAARLANGEEVPAGDVERGPGGRFVLV